MNQFLAMRESLAARVNWGAHTCTVLKAEVGSAESGGEAVAEETVSLRSVRTM